MRKTRRTPLFKKAGQGSSSAHAPRETSSSLAPPPPRSRQPPARDSIGLKTATPVIRRKRKRYLNEGTSSCDVSLTPSTLTPSPLPQSPPHTSTLPSITTLPKPPATATPKPKPWQQTDVKKLKLDSPEIPTPQRIISPPRAFSSPLVSGMPSPAFNSGTRAAITGGDAEDDLLLGLCPEDLSFNLSFSGDSVGGVKLPSNSVKRVIDESEQFTGKSAEAKLSKFGNPRVNAVTTNDCDPTHFTSPRVKSKMSFLYPSPVPKCNVPWKISTPKLSNSITSAISVKKEAKRSIESKKDENTESYNFDFSFDVPAASLDFASVTDIANSPSLKQGPLETNAHPPLHPLSLPPPGGAASGKSSKTDQTISLQSSSIANRGSNVSSIKRQIKSTSSLQDRPRPPSSSSSSLQCGLISPPPPLPTPTTLPTPSSLHSYPAGSFYGLPQSVADCLLEHRGISQLYDWQDTCLRLPSVARGDNLIYSLPTSGGKTLVAEVVILQQLLLARRDVLFILPFVSIVQEKVRDLAPFASALGFAVEEYAASKGGIPPRKRRRKNVVYVATIEKANGLVNSLIEHGRSSSIGLAVVDELHMLGDRGPRGATLEACLAKLSHCPAPSPRLVGLSATLSNISELASFLRAQVYQSDFRPVELVEHVKVGRCVYTVRVCEGGEGGVELTPARDIKDTADPSLDPDQLVTMVTEVVPESSCLVFCPTKKNCQNVALLLAKSLPSSLKDVRSSDRHHLLSQLALEAAGVCPTLALTVPWGVAYHHSGLTADERRLLEEGYLRGALCVLACTSTLAAGVNLPAKRVILRSPYIGSQLLSHSQYRQMIGRAGRSGMCERGESFLIAQPQDRHKVVSLLSSPYDSCSSSLLSAAGGGVLLSLLLTLIGLKMVKSSSAVAVFIRSTLLYVQQETDYLLSCCHDAIDKLVAMGYITMETFDGIATYQITTLGQATYKGCLPVESAHVIHGDLVKGQQCLALSSDLHLLFLATPPELAATIQPNWMIFFQTLTQLGPEELRVAELVGVRPAVLSKRATGACTRMSPEDVVLYHRFYLSLMLHSLLLRVGGAEGVWSVSANFLCSRGFLQSVVSSTSAFASCLTHFTQELPELWGLHLLLPAVTKKLALTASTLDLVPLLEIPGVRQGRARQLLKAGYRTPNDVAAADHVTLCEEIEHLFPSQAQKITGAAKAVLADRAEALMEEAEELMALAPPTRV